MFPSKKLVFTECVNAIIAVATVIFAIGAWIALAGSSANNEALKVIGMIICSLPAIIIGIVEENNTIDVWIFVAAVATVALIAH